MKLIILIINGTKNQKRITLIYILYFIILLIFLFLFYVINKILY